MQLDLELALEILERTPRTLRSMLQGLSQEWIDPNEGPDTFNAFENVAHLIQGERADWIARAHIILEQGTARPFDPFDRFAHREASAGKSMSQLLDEFEELRRGNLETLRGWCLTAADLERQGVHPALGTVTLGQLLATWVAHDLGHIAQTARVLAKQYRAAVGPWRAYLPVLDR